MIARSLKFVALFWLALSTAGCVVGMMVGNYGNFKPDQGITKAFEGYQVNPDLNYYISGSDVHPNAIMGLNKKFTLEESLWKKVEMTSKTLRELVLGMQQRADEVRDSSLSGFSMRDAGGREIGVWYSVLFATTSVRLEGENRVTVYRPPQHTYKEGDPDNK